MTTQTEQSAGQGPAAAQRERATRTGVVTSAARDKTIRVQLAFTVKHSKYGKTQQRRTTLHAHDERNEAGVGDIVEIVECRPISKTKRWRLGRILQKSAGGSA